MRNYWCVIAYVRLLTFSVSAWSAENLTITDHTNECCVMPSVKVNSLITFSPPTSANAPFGIIQCVGEPIIASATGSMFSNGFECIIDIYSNGERREASRSPINVSQVLLGWEATGEVEPASGSTNSANFTSLTSTTGELTFYVRDVINSPANSSCTNYFFVPTNMPDKVSRSFAFVEIDELAPLDGQAEEIDDGDNNPKTRLFVACSCSSGFIQVFATPNPGISDSNLPSCWKLESQSPGVLISNKTMALIPANMPGIYGILCLAGTSERQTIVIVRGGEPTPNTVGPPMNFILDDFIDPPSHAGGETTFDVPEIDITAYCDAPSWKCKVTLADSKIHINYNMDGITEVSEELVASTTDCETLLMMGINLNDGGNQQGVGYYYMFQALVAHENLHVQRYQEKMAAPYEQFVAAVEAITVPLKDHATAAAAKAAIKGTQAYRDAWDEFRRKHQTVRDEEHDHLPSRDPFKEVEHGVVDSMIEVIQSRLEALGCPPLPFL